MSPSPNTSQSPNNSGGAVIIPARWGSSRLPGKPLHPILGVSLLERVWRIAKDVRRVKQVVVATDDSRVADHVVSFGGSVVMTRPECTNGSERTYEAACGLDETPQWVVNLQGDAVLTPPWVLQALVDELVSDPNVKWVTPAVRMSKESFDILREAKAKGQQTGTTVVFNQKGQALYFSRSLIPGLRNYRAGDPLPVFRHIGVYGYQLPALKKYVELEPSPLELMEGLEQLRALENGIPIRIVQVDYKGRTHWSVDVPEDVARVEEIIKREGELVESTS